MQIFRSFHNYHHKNLFCLINLQLVVEESETAIVHVFSYIQCSFFHAFRMLEIYFPADAHDFRRIKWIISSTDLMNFIHTYIHQSTDMTVTAYLEQK